MFFVVWQRWGIVVLGIAVLGLAIGMLLAGVLHIEGRASGIPIGIGLLVAGALAWYGGKRMNRNTSRDLLDPATGETVTLRFRHTFFFVPVEWWAPVFIVAGIIMVLMPIPALLSGTP
jgi:hypothetical protein